MTDQVNTQAAPWPAELEQLISQLRYKPGYSFHLQQLDLGQGSHGLTLNVISSNPDSYHPENTIRVSHYFPVPPAAYNERSWRRWILDRLIELETHETCEFFRLEQPDGSVLRPYAPLHGPGNDPYTVYELSSDEEQRTSFRGDVKPPAQGTA